MTDRVTCRFKPSLCEKNRCSKVAITGLENSLILSLASRLDRINTLHMPTTKQTDKEILRSEFRAALLAGDVSKACAIQRALYALASLVPGVG